MKVCSKCRVEKPSDCFYLAKKTKCKSCVKMETKERHEKLKTDPEYQRKLKEYRQKNKDRIYARTLDWNRNNRERRSERERYKYQLLVEVDPKKARSRSRLYRLENPDKVIETRRKSGKKYAINNKVKIQAKSAKRRGRKLNATPNWLTKVQLLEIEDFYAATLMFRVYTGLEYHVDHIVPLQGKKVCGLHVPWNLQVLEASENMRKSNKFEEE